MYVCDMTLYFNVYLHAIIQMENGPGNMCIPFSWIKKWLNNMYTMERLVASLNKITVFPSTLLNKIYV